MEVAGFDAYSYILIKCTEFHLFPVIRHRFTAFFVNIITGSGYSVKKDRSQKTVVGNKNSSDFGLRTSDCIGLQAALR